MGSDGIGRFHVEREGVVSTGKQQALGIAASNQGKSKPAPLDLLVGLAR